MTIPGSALLRPLRWRMTLFGLANRASLSRGHRDPIAYARAMRKCYRLYREDGFMPDEALKLGLLHFKGDIRSCYISKARMVARQRFLNHPSFQHLTEDKALFYSYCEHLGIPSPKLLALFFRESSGLRWGRWSLTGETQWADFFDACCPNEFVVKPSLGVYGDGILFVDKSQPGFSCRDLFRILNTNRNYESFVIQECLQNHPDIMAINNKKGLQTLRLITFIDSNGNVTIVHAFFKIIVGDNRIDNHKWGTTGNLLAQINLNDGTLRVPILIAGAGPIEVPTHPETQTKFEGCRLPFWVETCEVAKVVAPKFLPMRSIGWDIAVTNRGIVIIEANARWDPPMFGTFGEQEAVFRAPL